MQTKEIGGFVNKDELTGYSDYTLYTYSRDYLPTTKQLKAKLIIEIPERRKEFTESEIREAFRSTPYGFKECVLLQDGVLNKKINELFKD